MKTETPFGVGKSVKLGSVMGSVSVPAPVTKKWGGGGGEISEGRIQGRDGERR